MLFWVSGGQFAQQIIQALEASFPYLPVALEPLICLSEGACFQATGPALSVASARNQTGLLKNSEVLGNGGLTHREGPHQLGNGSLA